MQGPHLTADLHGCRRAAHGLLDALLAPQQVWRHALHRGLPPFDPPA